MRMLSTGTSQKVSIGGRIWHSRFVRFSVYGVGSIGFTLVALLGGLLVYDSFTYHSLSIHEPIHPSINESVRGGPENRPILLNKEAETCLLYTSPSPRD